MEDLLKSLEYIAWNLARYNTSDWTILSLVFYPDWQLLSLPYPVLFYFPLCLQEKEHFAGELFTRSNEGF
jgi:hypothetical protein